MWLQTHLWHGAGGPALVGLRHVVRLPDALLRDAGRRGDPLEVGARPLRPVRDDGVRPLARGVRDVRALSGGAAVARRAARRDRRGEPDDRGHLAPRPDRALRVAVREGPDLREQRGGDAVAARRVLAADRALPLATRAALVPALLALYPPAMAFSLVYTGEHYVVDCVAGWAYAVATFVAVNLRLRVPRAPRHCARAGSPIERAIESG